MIREASVCACNRHDIARCSPIAQARWAPASVLAGTPSRTAAADGKGSELAQSPTVETAVIRTRNPSRQPFIADTLAVASIARFHVLSTRCSATGVVAFESEAGKQCRHMALVLSHEIRLG
jgi:hypothetical protein